VARVREDLRGRAALHDFAVAHDGDLVADVRGDPQRNKPGGRVSFEAGMHVSNVALYNPETKRPDRVRVKTDEKGKKYRVFASDGREVVA